MLFKKIQQKPATFSTKEALALLLALHHFEVYIGSGPAPTTIYSLQQSASVSVLYAKQQPMSHALVLIALILIFAIRKVKIKPWLIQLVPRRRGLLSPHWSSRRWIRRPAYLSQLLHFLSLPHWSQS